MPGTFNLPNPNSPATSDLLTSAPIRQNFQSIQTQLNNADGAALNAGSVPSTALSNQDGWIPAVQGVSSVVALGNRSYTVTFSSSVAALFSNGMRFRAARTVAAPTKCASLNGTTQFFSNVAPAGMGQTDSITESAWIKLSSYTIGGIASRNNGGTDGWYFYVNASGQLVLGGARAADDGVTSYQSVPLNKWVHVAASINTTTTTGLVYIDGVLVPSSYANNANTGFAAPTSTYLIGATGGGTPTNFFSGKIAQVASYSAVISGATILASTPQTLAGSETSLISAYSLNGSTSDLNTTNNNTLTANGSATTTTADSPFAQGATAGIYEYGVFTSIAGAVTTVQVPEGSAIPTSGGVSAVSYSTQATPYGFPKQKDKWTVHSLYLAQMDAPSNASTPYWTKAALSIPAGNWILGHSGCFRSNNIVNAAVNQQIDLNTNASGSPAVVASSTLIGRQYNVVNSATTNDYISQIYVKDEAGVSLAIQTTYNLYASSPVALASSGIRGDFAAYRIFAELATL